MFPFEIAFSLLLKFADLLAEAADFPLHDLVALLAGVVELGRDRTTGTGLRGGHDRERRCLFLGAQDGVVNGSIEIDARRKVKVALEVGVFGYGHGRLRGGGRGIGARGLGFLVGLLLHLGNAEKDSGGLLDGIEHESGRALVELPGGEGLEDFAEGDGHGSKVFQGWEIEGARLVAAQGEGATQAAGAMGEVVEAVLAALQGRTAAVSSVRFDVATG